MPFCVGLTGGIASGKTSAAKRFEELGAAVIDTDAIAHELTGPGGAAMAKIGDAFGADFVAPDGSLERIRMRQLVFGDPRARAKLEAILHPLIRAQARAQIAAAQQPYVMVVVPLLLETGAYRELVQRVLVVDCSEAQQIERAMRRSGLAESDVRAILAVQLSRAERLERADDVIDNSGGLETMRRQVDAMHAKYLALAQSPARENAVARRSREGTC
ncbi:MAG TPA: dephospho-CoA kinase [Burkholderiales bacterium]|nr:dephospho-CoA kinase [Burkholderiales bacterium]